MADLDTLLGESLSLIEKNIAYLKKLPIEERIKQANINILCKLTTSLLAIQRQNTKAGQVAAKLSDEELDQQIYQQIKQLKAKGFKFPEEDEE
jgi:hypothetical protein